MAAHCCPSDISASQLPPPLGLNCRHPLRCPLYLIPSDDRVEHSRCSTFGHQGNQNSLPQTPRDLSRLGPNPCLSSLRRTPATVALTSSSPLPHCCPYRTTPAACLAKVFGRLFWAALFFLWNQMPCACHLIDLGPLRSSEPPEIEVKSEQPRASSEDACNRAEPPSPLPPSFLLRCVLVVLAVVVLGCCGVDVVY